MQTIIYFIRHGEVYNPEKIIYGRLENFGLSQKGKEEIEKTAEFLKNKHIDTIYASPLQRATESAKIIKEKLHLSPVHISEEITEVKSSYQKRKFSELDMLQSEVYLEPLDPTDETIEQLQQRMLRFVDMVTNYYPGKQIAVVSHGDPIMALKAKIKYNSSEFYQFKTDHYIQHAEVYEIIVNDETYTIKSVFKPT